MEEKVNIIIPAIELNDELLMCLKEIKKKQSFILTILILGEQMNRVFKCSPTLYLQQMNTGAPKSI